MAGQSHTAGPWQIRDDYTREGPLTVIANIDGEYDTEGRASCTYDTVALCEDEFGDVLRSGFANARLIAAAPELLEALTEARQTIIDLKNARWSEAEGSDEEWVAGIDAAIRKATGDDQ